jgi:hypothetical protein
MKGWLFSFGNVYIRINPLDVAYDVKFMDSKKLPLTCSDPRNSDF